MDTTAFHYASQTVILPHSLHHLDAGNIRTRAPQGFFSSGDGYNRRFAAILSDFMQKERCVDDTVYFDKNLEEHWWRTIQFLTLVGRSGIVLNPSKFQFAQRSVDFAGFRISESCVEPLPKYLNAIQQFPTPKNIKDIRSWFGLINQVANYAKIRDLMALFTPFLSRNLSSSGMTILIKHFRVRKMLSLTPYVTA